MNTAGNGGILPPTQTKVTTGGGGDDDNDNDKTAAEVNTLVEELAGTEAENEAVRNRAKLAGLVHLSPDSLVGSYFHRVENGEIEWEGIVVGEMQPGMYLLHVTSGLEGAATHHAQVILGLEHLTAKDDGYEFRFYDNEETMRLAYVEFVGPLAFKEGGEG